MHQFLAAAFCLFFATYAASQTPVPEIISVSDQAAFTSDDGSTIRPLPSIKGVEAVHCQLPKGGVIQASRHKTVSQIWYVLEGKGEMWLQSPEQKEILTPLTPGVSLTVPLGYAFQFRNMGGGDLNIMIVNTTPWSGDGELIPVENHWPLKARAAK